MANRALATWSVRAGVVGVISFEMGFAVTHLQFRGVTIPQWNGLCRDGLVQMSQFSSPNAIRDCVLVADANKIALWLIAAGITLIACSLITKCYQACLRRRCH